MGEVGGTIALLALIGVGVWLFGSFALRVGGLLTFFLGLFGLLTKTPQALVSPLAARVFARTPLDRGAPSYEDVWEVDDRVGELDDAVTGGDPGSDPSVAMWSAQRNADVLAAAIDKPVEVVGADGQATPSG